MTVKQLRERCEYLESVGMADFMVIKSADDEGNSYQAISSVDYYPAVIGGYRDISLVAEEDLDDYEDEDLTDVICIW